MGRRGGCKRRGVRSSKHNKGSDDDSDEDYTVGVDEEDSEEGGYYCSSLAGDESDEFLEDISKGKMGFLESKRRNNKVAGKVHHSRFSRKEEKDVLYKDDDCYLDSNDNDEDDDDDHNDDDDDDDDDEDEDYEYENEDEDIEDDDDFDEDFTPSEIDLDLEDDELEEFFQKKKARRRPRLQEKPSSARGRKRKRNSDVSKRSLKRKKPTTGRGLKSKSIDRDSRQKKPERRSPASKRKRRRCGEISDSGYVISESSDFEYTLSEEEREQVREADTFCQDLIISSSHHSTCSKRLQEERGGDSLKQRRKNGHQRKKGKEKVAADLNIESVVKPKPVCGICLSEQGKKTVRGTLNCCDHYFCFACIMEWSKVESRCPLCKQRFVTISKSSRSTLLGFDLRTAVVQVPERDQVYQPSEDEYVDPYVDVICSECHEGGDDALMLLCDLCDSPAHTFCVGLGHQVPEGNWYCEGCRPTALASLDPILTPNHSELPATSAPPEDDVRLAIDLNRPYVPELPFTQEGIEFPSTPRHHHHGGGDPPAASSVSTVSERRRIQLEINNLLVNSRRGHLGGTSSGVSPMNSFGAAQAMQATQQVVASFPHSVTQEEALLSSHHSFSQGGFESSSHQRGGRAYASTSDGGFVSGMLQVGGSGIINSRDGASRLDYEEQHHLRSSMSSVADSSMPACYREVRNFR